MINVFGSSFDDSDIQAVVDVLVNQWSGMGPITNQLEAFLENRINSHVVLTNSASSALFLGIKAMNLPKNSEVILPSISWNSCVNAVIQNDLVPVFADVELETCNIEKSSVKKLINQNTSALFTIDYAGLACDYQELSDFDLPIIEDAAHAIDAKLNNKFCGTFGKVGIYSFDSVKNVATPDLGAVISDDESIIRTVKEVRYSGIKKSGADAAESNPTWWIPEQVEVSSKYAPNDVSASLALSQFKKLDDSQAIRQKIWNIYVQELNGLNGVILPESHDSKTHKHGLFTFHIRVLNGKRNELARYLLDQGVYTTVRYHPAHLQSIFSRYKLQNQDLPNSEILANQLLNLPLHGKLKEEEVVLICDLIKTFLRN